MKGELELACRSNSLEHLACTASAIMTTVHGVYLLSCPVEVIAMNISVQTLTIHIIIIIIIIITMMKQHLLSLCQTDLDKARILAVSAPHAGDWLHAIPLANCGLLLENEELRIAVGIRIGAPVCLPHECVCGSIVDKLGLHFFFLHKVPR